MTNQGGVQAAVRVRHGQQGERSYNEDWHELFDQEGIYATDDGTLEGDRIAGTFDERLLKWINVELSSSHHAIANAMQAYAEDQGFYNWSSMNTIGAA